MDFIERIKKAIEGCKVRFDIYGVIVFGSRVKGRARPESDFDILVVAEGINPKRHRRGDEIIQLKRCLPVKPADVLLLTPEEAISNFRNHNPLFLDIAEDGIVVMDRGNLLQGLIEETREYIKDKGIKRFQGGWRFPVKHREATYLSKVSNRDFAMAMLEDGQRDYLIGRRLIEDGFYDKAVYHFQQAIEKCIKSVLILNSSIF